MPEGSYLRNLRCPALKSFHKSKVIQVAQRQKLVACGTGTNQWREVASLSCPRSGVCAVTDRNYLYAIGGFNDTDERIDIVERFDPSSNNRDKLPSTHAKRADTSGTVIRGKVYVFGGLQPRSTATDSGCEMYDPATNMWTISICNRTTCCPIWK